MDIGRTLHRNTYVQGGTQYSFKILPAIHTLHQAIAGAAKSEHGLAVVQTKSMPEGVAERGPVCIYVGAVHELGPWLRDCPSDYMWTASYEYDFIAELLRWGLFFLDEGQIALVPNPRLRYVIALEPGCSRWRKNKKVRQHARMFTLTVNSDFEGSLRQCRRYE